jgi:hypothetical protein
MWDGGEAGDMTGRSVEGFCGWRGSRAWFDGPARIIDVMKISPLGALDDIANLG